MNITVQIPDSIAQSLRVPEAEAEQRLREELAAALYARRLLSFGKAAELAGVNRFAFADVIAEREISRHYGDNESNEATGYAGGQ
jgi:predicted HTH domain antitoxin